MKRKPYIEPLWPLSIILGTLVCFSVIITSLGIYFISKDNILNIKSYIILYFTIALCLFFIIYFIIILPRLIAILTVKNNCIIWRCPFRKPIKMSVKDCEYVGLEDSSKYVCFRYTTQQAVYTMMSRGDEMVYIYLSKTPFPQKYAHKAAAAPCKQGFIKFAYSDELCEELIKILPKCKTNGLVSFYNRMQASDRINKLNQKKKKRKKKN